MVSHVEQMDDEVAKAVATKDTRAAAFLRIDKSDPKYPARLREHLGAHAPGFLAALGNVTILKRKTLSLFCSARCPGNLILQTYDLARAMREARVTVISGFHGPMEQEVLHLLFRGRQPIVISPARTIERMRVPRELKQPLEGGRLLFLSPFPSKERRVSVKNAIYRNRFVAALGDKVFVPHAEPGSKTEALCRQIISWQKPLYALADPANRNLIDIGANRIGPSDVNKLR